MRHGWIACLLAALLMAAPHSRLSLRESSAKENTDTADAAFAERNATIQLCQFAGPTPAAPRPIHGVDCNNGAPGCGEAHWQNWKPIPWQAFAQGEYIGPHRLEHVPEYRLRVDDSLQFVYRLTREETATPYELNVGDVIKVESLTDANLDRELVIQPDGSITLRLLGQVRAADRTVEQLREHLEEAYKKYYKVPAMSVTPVKVNTRLEDLRSAVDARYGTGGQQRQAVITPEGTIQLPGIGSVPAQGLTLDELKREIDERYGAFVGGIEVTPVLAERAPRYVYVVGEVRQPGRFNLVGPTTVMQSIALAGGWNNGGNLREIVVFRRGDDWQLMATKLDMRGALIGKRPCPADEIWLRDSDIVVVPKSAILLTDDFIELVFTRGLYGVIPLNASYSYSRTTLLNSAP
jgi:polysaccharide export outer membrane protein